MRFSNRFLVLGLLAMTLPALAEKPAWPDPLIRQRADPWVYRHSDGYYYFTASVPEYDRIELRRSKTIAGLATAEPVNVWHKHDKGPMGNHVWAPELHYLDGRWYVYFAAGTAEDKWAIRIYVISTDAANPLGGTWREDGQVKTTWETFSLDATTFDHRGSRYLVWAQHTPNDQTNTDLYIARLRTPTRIEGTPVRIAKPEFDWERQGFKVNEGPAFLAHGNKVFLTFSASATDARYCMGLLTADADADLLDAKSWHKSPKPVLATDAVAGLYGPGHNSFTKDADGTDVIVFHARGYRDIKGEPLYDPNRDTYARRFGWTAAGLPDFASAISTAK